MKNLKDYFLGNLMFKSEVCFQNWDRNSFGNEVMKAVSRFLDK